MSGRPPIAGPTLLAVTSSTALVGVAVARAGVILAEHQVITDRRHAEELTPMVQQVLIESATDIGDVDRFAVDIGPGRFTGLRVGLATIRTLALATQRPVVGMTSLELLAADCGGPVCAVIDARRNEVFQQRFLNGVAVDEASVGPAEYLSTRVQADDRVIGDGADRYAEIYSAASVVHGKAPSATTLARLATGRPGSPGWEIEPLYLRDADVKINIKTRHTT